MKEESTKLFVQDVVFIWFCAGPDICDVVCTYKGAITPRDKSVLVLGIIVGNVTMA